MGTKKQVPVLRFKGFSEQWDKKRLADISFVKTGYPFNSKSFDSNAEYLVITNRNIQNESSFVSGLTGNRINISDPLLEEYVLNIDDILVTMDGTVGRTAKVVEKKQILAQRVGRLIAKSDSEFLYNYLNTGDFSRKMILTSHGGTIKHISLSEISDYESFLPNSIDEQIQIGNYFKQLDEQIRLHEQKRIKFTQLKIAMLEKMFLREGAMIPEIRLSGFTEKWKEKKLGEMASFTKGLGYSKSDLIDNGSPIVLYGRLYTKYQTVISDIDTFALDKKKSIYSKGNEVVVPASGETSEDIARASAISIPGVILGGDLNIISPNNSIDPIFLALTITFGNSKKELIRRAKGKSVVHLHNSDLKEIAFFYPSLKEQQKIGRYFQNLDQLIANSQLQVDKLKNIKESLLNKMFI